MSKNPIKELTFMQRVVRGLLSSSVLILPTVLITELYSKDHAEEAFRKIQGAERERLEAIVPVKGQDVEYMISRSIDSRGMMKMEDYKLHSAHDPATKTTNTQ